MAIDKGRRFQDLDKGATSISEELFNRIRHCITLERCLIKMDDTFTDHDVLLAKLIEGLQPERAPDSGCGSGGNAVWMAEYGWQVSAVAEHISRSKRRSPVRIRSGPSAPAFPSLTFGRADSY